MVGIFGAKIPELSTPALKKLAKPEDFVLIKTNESGYSNVYVKVYKKSCKFKALVYGRDLIPFEELIDEEWYGCCVLNIKRLFIGSSKAITIIAIEGLVSEIKSKLPSSMIILMKIKLYPLDII